MPKTKQTKIKKTDDQIRIDCLRREVHYYKGLAIIVVVLVICVFFAFAAFFSAMYLETRATRLVIEKAFSQFLPAVVMPSGSLPEEQPAVTVEVATTEEIETSEPEWLSFSKYGVTVYFPNSWTFLDKPFKKELHFFSDGVVRDEDSDAVGDLSVAFTKIDSYRDDYQGVLVQVDQRAGFAYDYESNGREKRVIVVPWGKNYLELRFVMKIREKENITPELVRTLLDKVNLAD